MVLWLGYYVHNKIIKHENYQHTNQILNIIFTKPPFLQCYNFLNLRNKRRKNYAKITQLSITLQTRAT